MVVDYTSNSPEVAKLHDLSSTNTISHWQDTIFLLWLSDNGPQFSSREFRQFAKQYGLKHVTHNYSPEYPQSNVKVEKAVQIVATLINYILQSILL